MKNTDELHLILTKEWFLEILNGDKKEEYRDFTEYYISRFCHLDKKGEPIGYKKFETVRFQLGYSKTQLVIEFKEILIESDSEDDEEHTYDNSNFVIVLGEIIEKINCEKLDV